MINNWLEAYFIPSAIKYSLSFVVLLIGSYTDFRTREVPDWINYGFIMSGIGLNLLFGITYSDYSFIINSLLGFAVFFVFAYIMFYTGQWGGGDSKMLMGLGAMIGIEASFKSSQFLFAFFVNVLFIGALYGLFWSAYSAIKYRKKFNHELKKILKKGSIIRAKKIIVFSLPLIFFLVIIVKNRYATIFFLSLALVILTTFYLWVFIKAIEKSSMYKFVEPMKLTEGDWIVNDVYVDKQYVCGPKDLGISKNQIKKLIKLRKQGKVKRILVKEGIPFVPSFLIAFLVTLIFGNPLTLLL